jgi:two-component system LytT family response regulator
MRVLIVEDEPKNVKILRRFITDYFPSLHIVGDAQTVEKAYELYNTFIPDVILLDIQLNKGTAFDFLDKIMPVTCAIIFITAYDNYAFKAFKYSAIDYLLKPVSLTELKNSLKKAEERINHENFNSQLKQLLKNINNPSSPKIALPVEGKLLFVDTDEIVYCRAVGPRTVVYTMPQQIFTTSKTIGEYEEILPPRIFFRIHNSYIVNINFITKYIKGRGGFVEMQGGTRIEVAARRKDEFLAKFQL